ncbi:hypothetical protein M3Y98_00932200 [Aphelenchoides besseyi]|nr:hypothetical protein M3Y98_00932200 [Aphelenchoides besseyi]KAI6194232.1 hypothetical protein M3Y96_01103000 [Aphelenchoides besseyi]
MFWLPWPILTCIINVLVIPVDIRSSFHLEFYIKSKLEGRISTRSTAVERLNRHNSALSFRRTSRNDASSYTIANGRLRKSVDTNGRTTTVIYASFSNHSCDRLSADSEDFSDDINDKKSTGRQCFEDTSADKQTCETNQADDKTKKTVRLKLLTSKPTDDETSESDKTNEPMESNSIPPTTPTYPPAHSGPPIHHQSYSSTGQHPAYAYVPPDGSSHYRLEVVPGYDAHPNSQPYYLASAYHSTQYVTETPSDPRYVLEQAPSASSYYNGYGAPQNVNTNYTMHYNTTTGYAPPVGMNTYEQRPQIQQRQFVEVKQEYSSNGAPRPLPPGAVPRPITQPPVHQHLSSTMKSEASEGKKQTTKAQSTSSTHSVTAVPIDAAVKTEPKKQFQCPECNKCVSSARNLTRHQNSCKARKEKKEGSGSGSPVKSEASGSPPKRPQVPIQTMEPQSAPPVHPQQTYHVYAPEGAPPNATVYHHGPPQYVQYSQPHTALPQSGSQTMFEYPPHNSVQGMSSGLHSAPPSVHFPPSGPPYAAATASQRFESQRSIDYSEDPYSYAGMPVDPFIDASIDEMAHNPLAFIGSPAASANSAPTYDANQPTADVRGPGPYIPLHPVPVQHSQHHAVLSAAKPESSNAAEAHQSIVPKTELSNNEPQKTTKSSKKGERKNSTPTPHRCEACLRYMCSTRSLRRHKSTCKLYLQSAELTTEDKILIAKNEENKCENCGKVLQSPSNLRRHRTACKQKSEEEPRPAAGSPTSRDSNESNAGDSGDSSAPKKLMPPPEAENSNSSGYPPSAPNFTTMASAISLPNGPLSAPPTTVIYVKQEEPTHGQSVYVDSNVTVGEHLRQHIGSSVPNQQSNKKGPSKRPMILGRKTSLQNPEHHLSINESPATCPPAAFHNPLTSPPPDFHAHSAPPVVSPQQNSSSMDGHENAEQNLSADRNNGVVETVNQVVEKIKRQNAEQQTGSSKRANSSAGESTPAKVMRVETKPKPLAIITTQPLQPMWRPPASQPQVRPSIVSQQQASRHVQPTNQQPAAQANIVPETVARYICPVCLKFYACRKNLRSHRINSHALSEEEADAEPPPPRLKVTLEGQILTPGYERENLELQKAAANGNSVAPTVAKNTGKGNGNSKRNSVNSTPGSGTPTTTETTIDQPPPSFEIQQQTSLPSCQQQTQGPTAYFMVAADPQPAASVEPSTPQYESLQPMRMEYSGSQYNGSHHSDSQFGSTDDLDVWDQIKSNVDAPFDSTGDDEIDRIAADLKRSAEGTQQRSPDNSTRPVQLAEADSTSDEAAVAT